MKKTIMIMAALTALLGGAKAQQMATDATGQKVTRISFDREEVTLVYANQQTATIETARIRRQADTSYHQSSDTTQTPTDTTEHTGILTVEPYEPTGEAVLFDMQGRRVARAEMPGVYIERRGKSVRKIVKMK